MATSGFSDFSTVLSQAPVTGGTAGTYTAIAEVVKVSFGEIKGETVDLTNLSSTYTELRPSGKKSIGEIEMTCNFLTATALNLWKTALDAGTIASYKLAFGGTATLVAQGFPTSIKLSAMDAQSPAGLTFDVKIQPIGDATLT